MKTSLSPKNSGAFALIVSMAFLVTCLIVFASIMYWLASSVKQTQRNITFTTSEAAAEAATEKAFSLMDRDFLNDQLGSSSTYSGLIPNVSSWPISYTFSDTNGNTGVISVNIGSLSTNYQLLGNQYANLQGIVIPCTITATATPSNQLYTVPATVSQSFNFAIVPAFQFAIFYNINLEIDPGAAMAIQGAVFSNGGIWSGNANPTYSGLVESAGTVTTTGTDPFLTSYTDAGTPASNFYLAGQPVSNVNPLVIPVGASGTNNSSTNVIAIIQLPPSSVAAPQSIAYAETNQVYDFNAACLIISNSVAGTNVLGGSYTFVNKTNFLTIYIQDSGTSWTAPISGHFTQLTNDFYLLKVTNTNMPISPTNYVPPSQYTNINYAGWTFATNVAFWDYREADTVQSVQIDISKLRVWLTNQTYTGGSNWNYSLCKDTGHGVNSIYVYNSVPLTSLQLPAVRLLNGKLLLNTTNKNVYYNGTNGNIVTSGLGIATPQPLYIKGDYNTEIDGDSSEISANTTNNTSHTYPAAILADAITILSANWNDSWNSSTALPSRSPANTSVNAAMLEGIVPSTSNYPTGGGANGYSGGVENFLRLLENWSSFKLYYNGSIMVMFPSQYATNVWQQTGNYYNAPTRLWGFDTNFSNPYKLPPLTPSFRTVIREDWQGN